MQANTPATSNLPELRAALNTLQSRGVDEHGGFYKTKDASLAFAPEKRLSLPSPQKAASNKAEVDLHQKIRRTEAALNLRGSMVAEMAQEKPNYDKVLKLAGQMLEQGVDPADLNWGRAAKADDKKGGAPRPADKVLENLPGLMAKLYASKKATLTLVAVFNALEDGLKKGSKTASSSQSAQAPTGQPLPRSATTTTSTTTTTTTTTTTSSNAVAPLTPRTVDAKGWSKAGTEMFKKEAELQRLLKEKAGLEKLKHAVWNEGGARFMSRNLEREIAPRLQAIDALLPSFEDVAKRRAARATPVTTTSTTATTALTTTTATTTGPSLTTAGPQSANAGGDGIDLLDIALALLDRLIDKEGVVPRNEFRQWAAMKDEFVALRDGEIRRRTTEKTTGSGPVPAGQPSKIDKLDALIAQQQALVNKYATTVMRYETQQTGEMLGAPVTLRERDRHDSLMVKARDERDRLLALKALEEEAINSAANASNTTTTTTVTTPRHN